MTGVIEFGRLQDVPPRDAWHHEAHALTPWLAENLDRLQEVLGIELELEDTEFRVGPFAADILARDVATGGRVLIENQLEQSDHGHLGQIMTYLAGLDAQTMVWIAPSFREPHLSAIQWLNEHTVDPFAFFAVQLRVVRIGESPFAPLFEIIERPNSWNRHVQEKAREATGGTTVLGQKRLAFWEHFIARHPAEGAGKGPDAASSRLKPVAGFPLTVVQYLARRSVGVFVRALRGGSPADVLTLLEPHRQAIESRTGSPLGPDASGYFLVSSFPADTDDQATWNAAADWLHGKAEEYETVLCETLSQAGVA